MYQDRDLSWLAFNERIIQEAEDKNNALTDRMKFLAIYSSNLEEFYKVRVASHRFAQKFKGDKKNKFGFKPSFVLNEVSEIVDRQQERLGKVFVDEILPMYAERGILLAGNDDYTRTDKRNMRSVFEEKLKKDVVFKDITKDDRIELRNQHVYLYAVTEDQQWIIDLDYERHGRFIELHNNGSRRKIAQLDDIVKYNIKELLGIDAEVYAIKVSRDAELYIEEEQELDIVKKIKKSVGKRETGLPARLLFDQEIPYRHLNILRKKVQIETSGLIPGGRYHNFYDFMGFPKPSDEVSNDPELILSSKLESKKNWMKLLKKQDVFLSFPYQPYDYVTQYLDQLCTDPDVTAINITLYRVARESAICQSLEKAAMMGKKVFVLDEVQARFDEESNIYWGERLEQAGATVRYGVPDLKVHAKVFTAKRKEGDKEVCYAYLGTGNFNEKTAKIYGDLGLFTTDNRLTDDLDQLFDFLKGDKKKVKPAALLCSPFNLRSQLLEKIQREIDLASKGKEASIQIKVNSLEDPEMINAIRTAADAGVKINIIVRGICCYTPLNDAQKKNIKVVSVVDGFLEHTRIFHFHNNGKLEIYLASADWMTRNLSHRVEVAFPITNEAMKQLLLKEMELQLSDNVKGRDVMTNTYLKGRKKHSSQRQMFDVIKAYERG